MRCLVIKVDCFSFRDKSDGRQIDVKKLTVIGECMRRDGQLGPEVGVLLCNDKVIADIGAVIPAVYDLEIESSLGMKSSKSMVVSARYLDDPYNFVWDKCYPKGFTFPSQSPTQADSLKKLAAGN